jgi:methylase of polypeptide subunit release factors
LWTTPFLVPLPEAGVRTILELGCGTGNDAARLAGEGYSVTATDLSGEAVEQARANFRSLATFLFSEAYLRELLSGWRELQLVAVPIHTTGEPFKHVWRGIARR